jgi:hypothetical protein
MAQPEVLITLKNKNHHTAAELASRLYTDSKPRMITSPAYVKPGSSPKQYKSPTYENDQYKQKTARYFSQIIGRESDNIMIKQATLPLNDPTRISLADTVVSNPHLLMAILKQLQVQYSKGIPQQFLEERTQDTQATTLILAVKQKNLEAVKILVAAGADINAVDKTGNSAFYWAIQSGNKEIFDFLLNNPNTSITLKNKEGCTAIHLLDQRSKFWPAILDKLFESKNNEEINDYLLEKNTKGENALTLTARHAPQCMPRLLRFVVLLPLDQQEEIYRSFSVEGKQSITASNAENKTDDNKIFLLNTSIHQNLERLKSLTLVDTKTQDNPITTLKTQLEACIQAYASSNKSTTDYNVFFQQTCQALKACRDDKNILFQPDDTQTYICKVLTKIALAISCIGLFYLAFEAGKNQASGRSMLIQQDSEIIINELEEILKVFPHSDETYSIPEAMPYDARQEVTPSAPPSTHYYKAQVPHDENGAHDGKKKDEPHF